MEQYCYFVCSRGILKSCNFHSENPTSSCSNDKKYLINMIKGNKMFNGMSIYVCSDLLKFFVNIILPRINKKFVLVSGDSDINVPLEILNNYEFNILINSNNLIKWFIQNTQIQNNKKIIQLPIGLDYHTISNNPSHFWKSDNEGHLPKEQEEILVNIRNTSLKFFDRIPKIYVNFTISNDRFNQRKNCLKIIPNNLLIKNESNIKRTETWNNIIKYSFVLSPFGNGMDCHRTWETLCLGSIPIIKAPNFKKLFEDLPVLIVDDWSEINQEVLINTIDKFKEKTFNYDKLTLKYWIKQIYS
jgi:hypothetical protein